MCVCVCVLGARKGTGVLKVFAFIDFGSLRRKKKILLQRGSLLGLKVSTLRREAEGGWPQGMLDTRVIPVACVGD